MSEQTPSVESREPKFWQGQAPWMKFLRRNIWTVGIIYGLVIITGMRFFLYREATPPPVYGELPSVSLVDQNGAAFDTAEEMRGEIWVVGFIFTRCTTTCPTVTAAMRGFQEEIHDARLDKFVEFASVSVDPEHDTPEVLRAYAQTHGVSTENWTFLTGSQAEIHHFVVDGFKLAIGEKKELPGGAFDIAHSLKLGLVDRRGKIRGFYSLEREGEFGLDHLFSAILRLTREDK